MSLKDLARELSRRRTIGQSVDLDRDVKAAYAECLVLHLYDRVPTLDDLKQHRGKLTFLPDDDKGRSVRVVAWGGSEFRIFESWMNVDVFVFVRLGRQPYDAEVLGWISKAQVEQAPQVEFESKFKPGSVTQAYQITPEFMVKMPVDFDFTDPCPHADRWGAIWDYATDGWLCFGCDRFTYDRHARELVQRENQPG